MDFIGRVPKKKDPSDLIRAVLSDPSLLQRAEFRSLKGPNTAEAVEGPMNGPTASDSVSPVSKVSRGGQKDS